MNVLARLGGWRRFGQMTYPWIVRSLRTTLHSGQSFGRRPAPKWKSISSANIADVGRKPALPGRGSWPAIAGEGRSFSSAFWSSWQVACRSAPWPRRGRCPHPTRRCGRGPRGAFGRRFPAICGPEVPQDAARRAPFTPRARPRRPSFARRSGPRVRGFAAMKGVNIKEG